MGKPLKAEARRYMQQFTIPLSPSPMQVAILTVPFPMNQKEYESLASTLESWKVALTQTNKSGEETDDET